MSYISRPLALNYDDVLNSHTSLRKLCDDAIVNTDDKQTYSSVQFATSLGKLVANIVTWSWQKISRKDLVTIYAPRFVKITERENVKPTREIFIYIFFSAICTNRGNILWFQHVLLHVCTFNVSAHSVCFLFDIFIGLSQHNI